jgi:hypothetical protein
MKHFLASLIAMSILSLTASAQVRVAVGPKLGINFATLTSDVTGFAQTGGRTGMLFGAIVDIGFGNMFAVQVEPTYIMKGGSDVTALGVSRTRALNYFEFPILFKARWLQGKFVPFSFMGPSIGFNVSATEKSDAPQGFFGGQAQEVDISPSISGTDFGLVFGSGLEFMASSAIGILLDTRYALGLSNTFSSKQALGFVATTRRLNRGNHIQDGALFYLGK